MSVKLLLAQWWKLVGRFCLLSVVMMGVEKPGTPLMNICEHFGVPETGLWYLHSEWEDHLMDSNAIQVAINIKADRSFWVGYENGGFDWRPDIRPVLTMTMYMVDGDDRWIEVYFSNQTPDVYYLLPYSNTDYYADANGLHPGYHPCGAFLLTVAEYENLVSSLRQPEFADSQSKS